MPPSSDITMDEEEDDELAQEIEAQVNEWSSNSNACFTIQLDRGDGSVITSFQPSFTYPMFGEEEAIFGYQGLSITLSFRAHDLKPKLDITYDKIFPAQGDVRPTDIQEALMDFLPESAFTSTSLKQDTTDFKPPGQLVQEYQRGDKTYQIYCASLGDPVTRSLLENMQILVPLFIEGGSILELEQDWTAQRWKIFIVYEIKSNDAEETSPYTLVGFGTSYRCFTFPERARVIQFDDFSPSGQSIEHYLPSPTSETNQLANPPDIPCPLGLPSRERLSQFLVLPSFHHSGHGQELYNTMYRHLTQADNVREFTVEDPNERFDDLRDLCDLLYLRKNVPDFAALRVNTAIPPEKLLSDANIPVELIVPSGVRKQVMRDTKIMPRQFDRLVEMHTLSFIPRKSRSRNRITRREKTSNEDDRAYYFWRMYVKHRLYIFNQDQLVQIEHFERVEKLEAALDSVLEAYSEMIDKVEEMERDLSNGKYSEMSHLNSSGFSKRKRPVAADDEDEDDAQLGRQQDDEVSANTNGHKKLKV